MNILILMAGGGEAFREAGYLYPKNLVEIDGLPLLQHVLDRIAVLDQSANHFICLIQKDENRQYHTGDVVSLLLPQATVVEVSMPTAGAACTALLAIELINSEQPLLILNGDQIIDVSLKEIVEALQLKGPEGGIAVFDAVHPRWSYVKCDENKYVIEAAEKRPISRLATAGLYYFAHGADFVSAAMAMIKKDAHVGGHFYVCPCYNEMILKQARIGVHQIPYSAYFSLASPQGIQTYEKHLQSLS